MCAENCGLCMVSRKGVKLPCGHTADLSWSVKRPTVTDARSWQMGNLDAVQCQALVSKPLQSCEHSAMVPCHLEDVSDVKCQARCDAALACCSKSCSATCHRCQTLSKPLEAKVAQGKPTIPSPAGRLVRSKHAYHTCPKLIENCGHPCGRVCGDHSHSTTTCGAACLRVCNHGACPAKCCQPCAPCE